MSDTLHRGLFRVQLRKTLHDEVKPELGESGADDSPSPAVAFRTDETSREWQCNVAAGVSITLTVTDSNGMKVYSSPSTVRESPSHLTTPKFAD